MLPIRVTEGTETIKNIEGRIKFNNVAFKYIDNNSQIMENLSFDVKPDSFVAIMGESGVGKTTILNLIFRLYDPHQGSI
jgi:ATP-binding cassette subfamily B protein